jgi:hypothetical protein
MREFFESQVPLLAGAIFGNKVRCLPRGKLSASGLSSENLFQISFPNFDRRFSHESIRISPNESPKKNLENCSISVMPCRASVGENKPKTCPYFMIYIEII